MRRYSWRASFTATGQAALEIAAAARDGNWLRGAAVGVPAPPSRPPHPSRLPSQDGHSKTMPTGGTAHGA
jgi:hypothetical protein